MIPFSPGCTGGRTAAKCQADAHAEFYLVMDVGVGGIDGWFPDGEGGKPWLDDSGTGMSGESAVSCGVSH